MNENNIFKKIAKQFNINLNPIQIKKKYFIDSLGIKYQNKFKNSYYDYSAIEDFIIFYYLIIFNKKKAYKNILDLGSGWGKWSIINHKLSKIFFYDDYNFFNVEGLKSRIKEFDEIMNINKYQHKKIKNINAPIHIEKTKVNFYNGDIKNWFGQSITVNDHKVSQIKNFFLKILKKKYISYNIQTVTLEEIIKDNIIDLCIMDIQGSELILIKKEILLISKKIKYLIIGTHDETTEMCKGINTHQIILNTLRENNFLIKFEAPNNSISIFNGIKINISFDGMIVAKNLNKI
jgi:hypothetical protein